MASAASAWNATGHRVAALVAWDGMSPQARAEAGRLLAAHPRYKEDLLADLPPKCDPAEWAFLTAATWPDLIRDRDHPMHDRGRPAWHYVNYPFAPDGDERGFPAPAVDWKPRRRAAERDSGN